MSTRALSILGVIAAMLVAYVLMFEHSSVTSKELADRAGRVLPSFVRDKVERITVQRRGVEVVLERKREADGLGALTLVAPLKAAADTDATDHLLGELEWLSARRTVEDNGQFGVDAPRFRVSYLVGGDTHVLAVGKDDVHGEGLYVRVDREPKLFVVPKTLLEVIDHEPGYFRAKALFPELTVAWANKLELRQPAHVHSFSKQGKHWWLGEPSEQRYADDKRIDELLHALASLRASRDVEPRDHEAARAALATPTLSILVSVVPDETREDKKALALKLEVGAACGQDERYARVDQRLVCIRNSELTPFELGELALAEPRLFRAQPNEVQRFVLARGKEQLAWKRDGSSWKSDVDAPADGDAIESWLGDLAAARVLRTAPLAGFSAQGRLRLELVDDQFEEISYGALVDDALPVRRGEESLLVLFPGSVYDRLTPNRERFVPLAIWKGHQPSEVVSFEAQLQGKQRKGALVDGAWHTDGGVDRVRGLVRELVNLEAVSYVTSQVRPEHGIGQGKLVLGLRGGKSLSLELGAATDRGVYARSGGGVIEIGSATLALIAELAGGPPAPMAEEEDDEHEGHDEEEHAH
ncbi:MAG TPA: DUF4340 domain-containing protein [Polyangiales bacterium]